MRQKNLSPESLSAVKTGLKTETPGSEYAKLPPVHHSAALDGRYSGFISGQRQTLTGRLPCYGKLDAAVFTATLDGPVVRDGAIFAQANGLQALTRDPFSGEIFDNRSGAALR